MSPVVWYGTDPRGAQGILYPEGARKPAPHKVIRRGVP